MDVCAGCVAMAMPLTLKSEFGLRDDLIGVIIGTTTIVYMVASTLTGMLADRWGPIFVLKTGVLIIALDCFVFSLSKNLGLFILCAFGSPLGHAFFWPAFQAWFSADVDRKEIARRLGIFAVGWSIGLNVIGPKLSGDLMEKLARAPFSASWIIAVGVFLFFQIFKPELKRHEVHPTQEADEIYPVEIRRKFLTGARLANLMAVYALVTMRNFVPLLCVDWGLSPSSIGTLIMILGVSHSLSFLVLSMTHRWHYRLSYLMTGQFLGLLGLLSFALGGMFWLQNGENGASSIAVPLVLPALVLSGLMAGIAFMSSAFYGLFGEEEKGKNSGINESVIGAANVLALYLGGGAVYSMGSFGPYWVCSFMIGLFILIQLRVLRRVGKAA
ncbi:MAG: hypothetical protein DIKNOCCD_03189 [bacterium]|nr:hypothetical protein [bacterium]